MKLSITKIFNTSTILLPTNKPDTNVSGFFSR